MEMKMQ